MINHREIKEALLIRRIEETFLELFSKGKLNGTVHTSVGQEFSAVAFAGQLKKGDFIFSNHRCHGHYISFTNDCYGLLAELMGKKTGTCGGIGSSQHLCNKNFFSNGIQGGIVPVAAGYALANKIKGTKDIGVVYIGDGTLGEGVLYETMNIISKWEIPLIIVCENNFYAQSTPQSVNLAGDILKRPEAFGIKTFKSDTWNVDELLKSSKEAIHYARTEGKPVFHLVETYRLNAHSKGDDDRDKSEVESYFEKDYLNQFAKKDPETYSRYLKEINYKINGWVNQIETDPELSLDEYLQISKQTQSVNSPEWNDLKAFDKRQVEMLNNFFIEKMEKDEKTIFLGEDVLSPYGGAFKVARNLSHKYPQRVFSSPISEGALVGISNGLALAGFKPYTEIMFGDFMTLTLDQIINHASKFQHMYNGKASCPVVIRTPMGGNRGYGPTHSQTLDKFLIGIDNTKTIALNYLVNPAEIYEQIHLEKQAVIVIENKTDYGKKIGKHGIENYSFLINNDDYPVIKVSPVLSKPTATIVTYGGNVELVLESLQDLFFETDLIPEVIILTKIHPVKYEEIIASVNITGKLFIVEEGSTTGGLGSEIISSVSELTSNLEIAKRIGALDVPIPSVKSLEQQVLPNKKRIIESIQSAFLI